jgi:hypothetical protein
VDGSVSSTHLRSFSTHGSPAISNRTRGAEPHRPPLGPNARTPPLDRWTPTSPALSVGRPPRPLLQARNVLASWPQSWTLRPRVPLLGGWIGRRTCNNTTSALPLLSPLEIRARGRQRTTDRAARAPISPGGPHSTSGATNRQGTAASPTSSLLAPSTLVRISPHREPAPAKETPPSLWSPARVLRAALTSPGGEPPWSWT